MGKRDESYHIISYCAILYCIILYCIVLYCTVLYCIVLYCIVLYCIVLYCIVLYCIGLHCIALHCIALHCIALYCIVLYCIVLYCIVLYCIVLCYIYYIVLHYIMLHYIIYSTLLYSTLLYSTLLYSTLLYSTLLYSTLLYSTLLYSTLLYSTLLYSTLLYSTLLYSTVDLTPITFLPSTSFPSRRPASLTIFHHIYLIYISSYIFTSCVEQMLFVLFLVLMLAVWRVTELEPEEKEVSKPREQRLAVDRLLQAAPPAILVSAERAPTKLPQICPAYFKALEGAELKIQEINSERSAVLGFGATMRGAPACLLTAQLVEGERKVLQLREQEPGKEEPGRVLLCATSDMELWSGELQRGELLGTMEALPLPGHISFKMII